MSCPICNARTSGLCDRCQMEQRLAREHRERMEAERAAEEDDDQ